MLIASNKETQKIFFHYFLEHPIKSFKIVQSLRDMVESNIVEIKKNFDNSQIVKNADYDSDDEDDLNEA
jgi:hypothetical protein